MKKVALAAAVSVAATSAYAGTLADPIIEAPVIEQSTATSGGFVVPLILLILIGAAIASR